MLTLRITMDQNIVRVHNNIGFFGFHNNNVNVLQVIDYFSRFSRIGLIVRLIKISYSLLITIMVSIDEIKSDKPKQRQFNLESQYKKVSILKNVTVEQVYDAYV